MHAVAAISLWRFFGFESLRGMLPTEPLLLAYTVAGMVALGFVPGLLYARWGSVSPALLVGGLFCLSGYGTWVTVGGGATPVGPTAFGWYVILWVGVAVFALGAGWIEVKMRA